MRHLGGVFTLAGIHMRPERLDRADQGIINRAGIGHLQRRQRGGEGSVMRGEFGAIGIGAEKGIVGSLQSGDFRCRRRYHIIDKGDVGRRLVELGQRDGHAERPGVRRAIHRRAKP